MHNPHNPRIEEEIGRDLMPLIRGKIWFSDFCNIYDSLLKKYVREAIRALDAKNWVEADRAISKAYRVHDIFKEVCGHSSP